MHDAAHGVLVRTKWLNDPLSQWLCAWPVFTDTIPYRHYHLVHHRTTQQPDDPDLHLSAKFPITKASYRRKFIRDITGQTGFKLRRAQIRNALGKPGTASPRASRPSASAWAGWCVANLVLLAILTAFGKPHYYLMFWILPLLTWQQVVTRIRNIAEHAMVPDNNDPMKQRPHDLCEMVGTRDLRALLGQLSRRPSSAVLRALLQPAEAARAAAGKGLRPKHGNPEELRRPCCKLATSKAPEPVPQAA